MFGYMFLSPLLATLERVWVAWCRICFLLGLAAFALKIGSLKERDDLSVRNFEAAFEIRTGGSYTYIFAYMYVSSHR